MPTILLWDTSHAAMREVAEAFVRDGDTVYCIGGAVPGARPVAVDLSAPDGAQALSAALKGVPLDMLVLGLPPQDADDAPIGASRDYDALLTAIERGLLGAAACLQGALPMLRAGSGKRIAVLSAPEASIALCGAETGYAEHMASAALNMQEKLWFNELRPEGFTFRNYCRARADGKGMTAKEYFTRNLSYDDNEPYVHSDENRLVMRDAMRVEIPW